MPPLPLPLSPAWSQPTGSGKATGVVAHGGAEQSMDGRGSLPRPPPRRPPRRWRPPRPPHPSSARREDQVETSAAEDSSKGSRGRRGSRREVLKRRHKRDGRVMPEARRVRHGGLASQDSCRREAPGPPTPEWATVRVAVKAESGLCVDVDGQVGGPGKIEMSAPVAGMRRPSRRRRGHPC